MTEYEIEIKDKIIEYTTQNGVDGLSSNEIDFIETLDNLADNITLSQKRFDFMIDIANKLGVR